jgi:hypothetical protein
VACQRLMARNSLTEEQAMQRVQSQMPPAERLTPPSLHPPPPLCTPHTPPLPRNRLNTLRSRLSCRPMENKCDSGGIIHALNNCNIWT